MISASSQDRFLGTSFTLLTETAKKKKSDKIHETTVFKSSGNKGQ